MKLASKRRLGLGLLVLLSVCAWSLWALAQHPPQHHRPGVNQSMAPPPNRPGPGRVPPPPPPAPSAHREGGHAEQGEGESEQLAPINWTDFSSDTPPFIAMLVNFGILMAGYYLFGKKPVAAALVDRRDTIAKDIDEAHKMLEDARTRAQTYQAKLESMEGDAATARAALTQAGEADRERIIAEAEAKAERMRKDAEFQVEQELKQIRQDLWRSTVEDAVAAAEELLKKRVSSADQERIAEEYLADLGGKKSPTSLPAPKQETAS